MSATRPLGGVRWKSHRVDDDCAKTRLSCFRLEAVFYKEEDLGVQRLGVFLRCRRLEFLLLLDRKINRFFLLDTRQRAINLLVISLATHLPSVRSPAQQLIYSPPTRRQILIANRCGSIAPQAPLAY
ncbi:hypothetical protein EYF80_044770 [Liparis tanakae]|uniref:Uncharacterized protein n=1 Tax=Liparis tanakae TaxID=230148 RepID=A0A4Z2FW46_9TELE|nr:hypothetical protein EYF80_044770 [Liparis tanakae]